MEAREEEVAGNLRRFGACELGSWVQKAIGTELSQESEFEDGARFRSRSLYRMYFFMLRKLAALSKGLLAD